MKMDTPEPMNSSPLPTSDANTCSPPPAPLTKKEKAALNTCRAAIDRYEKASLDAGQALFIIKGHRLFRENYGSFEAYVAEECAFDVRRAQQLIAAYKTVRELEKAGVKDLPLNEAQARPLASLDPKERPKTWQEAVGLHGGVRKLSKAKVQRVVDKTTGAKKASRRKAQKPNLTAPALDWPKKARKALKRIPKEHRAAIVEIVSGFPEDVTPEIVAEAFEGYSAAVLEDGVDTATELVGEAVDLIPDSDECDSGAGTAEDPITDLDVIPDTEPGPDWSGGVRKNVSLYLPSDEKRPMLAALPTIIVPNALKEGVPKGVSQLIVECGELERLGGPVREGLLLLDEIRDAAREHGVKKELQRTNEHVDWARYTTNPMTGCWHGCRNVFCYAAGIAQRLFPQKFVPTLYPARLDHFQNTSVPDVSHLDHDEAWRERSVFCVSMGDLFGSWVPEWYVESVLEEVRLHPEWFVFFLTKHPKRLSDFTFPANSAVGLTLTGDEPFGSGAYTAEQQAETYVTYARQLAEVESALFTWISLEPFRGDVGDLSPFFDAGVQLLAMGGQSRTSFSPAMQPELRWVDSVRQQVRGAGIHLFEKENLTVRPKEIPFPEEVPPAIPEHEAKPAKAKRTKTGAPDRQAVAARGDTA